MNTILQKLKQGLFVGLVLAAPLAVAADFGAWGKWMRITFPGYTKEETLTNFPALIVFSNGWNGVGFTDFKPDGSDLLFTDATWTTNLNHEIEQWNDANAVSWVWVQVPELTSNTTIYAQWGNANASMPACTTNGATWANGYAGVWHLKEASGPFYDSTSNANHGADNVGSTGKGGTISDGQQFNGSSDYINTGASATLKPSSFTYECWMKEAANQNTKVFMGCYENMNRGVVLGIKDTVNNVLKFRINGGQLESAALATGVWHHIVGTYSGGIPSLYVGGTRIATSSGYTDPVKPTSYTNFNIGRWNGGSSQYFNGWLDEVRVSNVARSSNWVWACYMNQTSNSIFVAASAKPLGTVFVFK
jgi:hypothetical protein